MAGKYIQKKQLLKKIGLTAALVVAGILFLVGLSGAFLRSKVGIKDFDSKFGSVTPTVRQALYREIETAAQLNSGKKDFDAGFVLRNDDTVKVVENEKQSYGAMYVDSESLKISLFVQINWGSGFSQADESFMVRVECADKDHWKYDTNHCVMPRTDEPLGNFSQDNFRILSSYGLDELKTDEYRNAALAYLKAINQKAEIALLLPESIEVNGTDITAKLKLDFGKEYQIKIENNSLSVSENGSELWRYDSSLMAESARHYSLISNYLPTELATEDGTDFVLRWDGDNKLKIAPDYCKGSDNDERLIERTKEWLKAQAFSPDDFEISMVKSCAR